MDFISAKTIISGYSDNNKWFGGNYNMNIYRGCMHGCIYCDSRSSCYNIDNFDTVRIKENAIQVIEKELQSKKKKGVVFTGSMSDPYTPFEKKYKLTKSALRLLDKYIFGAGIATKNKLICRDIDILKNISQHSPVITKITITTYDDELAKKIEPYASKASERFNTIETLAKSGIFTGILLMPILPFITDTEDNILNIVKNAKNCGASFIFTDPGVTLRDNQRDWYYEKLDKLFPGLKDKYIKNYRNSYLCNSLNARHLLGLFKNECIKNNILYKMDDIIKAYRKNYDEPAWMRFIDE